MATANLACTQCGKAFSLTTSPAIIKRTKFCSRECSWKKSSEVPPLLESLKARLDVRRAPQPNGCILYTGQNNGKYGQIEYRRKTYLAHRAAYMVYKGEIEDGAFVCHSCDTPLCINPNHLWLGSPSDNVQDMHQKGRQRYNPVKKFSDEQIDQMLSMLAAGKTHREVSKQFSVSQTYLSLLRNGHRRSRT